ncbi:TniQ family protein [Rhizobium johnstonii]|uniref:TniQ family protein n=1 Tax=Rhizobium johnstonii TaxID=3019933 RepID=UPI003F97745D
MSRYADLLPFNINESVVSYFSRLAAALDYNNAREFGKDTRVDFNGLIRGNDQALESFADLLECHPKMLARGAVVRSDVDKTRLIAGNRLLGSQMSQSPLRFCPHCVVTDEENLQGRRGHRSFGRLTWLVDAIRTCPLHQTKLVALPGPNSPLLRYDYAAHLEKGRPSFSALVADSAPMKQDTLEQYIASRIHGKPETDDWLKQFPLYVIIRISELSGVVARHGVKASFDDLQDAERSTAAGLGFDALSAGESDYTRFIRNIARRSAQTSRIYGGGALFGALYRTLLQATKDRAYDPFRKILRGVAIQELPIGSANSIFGKVDKRQVHSVYTASREFGVGERLLKKLIARSELVDDEVTARPPNQICLNAQRMEEFVSELVGSVEVPKARTSVGANRMQFEAIVRGKFLVPLSGPDPGDRVMRGPAIKRRFRSSDVEAFLDRLSKLPTKAVSENMCDMETACRKAGCSFMEALKLALNGDIKAIAFATNAQGIAAILLDPVELKAKTSLSDHGCLTLKQTAMSLPAKHETLRALIDSGYLKSVTRRNPRKRFAQTLIEPEELERFKREYVSAWEIAQIRRSAIRNVRRDMAPALPAFDPQVVRGLFYRRSEINL